MIIYPLDYIKFQQCFICTRHSQGFCTLFHPVSTKPLCAKRLYFPRRGVCIHL